VNSCVCSESDQIGSPPKAGCCYALDLTNVFDLARPHGFNASVDVTDARNSMPLSRSV
jgi:hypothetical protein